MGLAQWYNRTLNRIWGFIEDRTGMKKWALRPQPAFTFKPSYWTGGFVATAFLYQVLSGGLLLLYYQPSVLGTLTSCGQAVGAMSSAPAAWCSTYYIIHSIPMGSLLLTTHLYGAYAMIFLMFVHFYRGFYLGAYKTPREFSWMVGTLLMFLTLGMAFTGYLLPYTQLSVNATNVGMNLATAIPGLNAVIAPLLMGDQSPQGLLGRMFAAHVVLLPLALGALLYAHIALFESHGIAPPASSDPLQRRRLTTREDEDGVPFMPHIFFYITKWALLYLGVLFAIAALWPWNLAPYYGNTAVTLSVTEPDWYFLWLFKVLDFTGIVPLTAGLIGGALAVLILFYPFIERIYHPGPRTHPRDRPVTVILTTSLLQMFIILTVWGGLTPGVQIPPLTVAETLAPMVLVNIVLVTLYWTRYQASYRARLFSRRRSWAGPYPIPAPPAVPSAAGPVSAAPSLGESP